VSTIQTYPFESPIKIKAVSSAQKQFEIEVIDTSSLSQTAFSGP